MKVSPRKNFLCGRFWRTFFASLGFYPTLFAAEPGLISTSVGRVHEHFVTSREVQISYLLEQALYNPKAFGPQAKKRGGLLGLALDSKEFSREVNGVLLERAVSLEAKSFAAARTESAEVVNAEKVIREKLFEQRPWQELEVSSEELRSHLEVKLQAKKFIRFKADSAVVPVTELEARQYYEQNKLKFGELPFENFKDNIRTFLTRQQVDRRLKDWFEVLQAKYKVRNFLGEY